MSIVVEVSANALQCLVGLALELVVRAEPAQGADRGGDLAMEDASGLCLDEVAGGVAGVGVKQMRGFLPR